MDFMCPFCNLCFASQFELYTHSYLHKNEAYREEGNKTHKCLFTCNVCKKTFKKHAWFLQHKKKPCMATYECFLCSKTFAHVGNLKLHFQLHTYETKFKCETCNKAFYREDKLTVHQRTHSEELYCSTCRKPFKTKKDLKRHRQSHEAISYHKCTMCTKQYKRKHSLRLHSLTHTAELPHSCLYCKQKFLSGSHVKKHEKIHMFDAADNQCLCLLCGGRFDIKALEKHICDAHNGILKFQCNICQKIFNKKGNLTYHQKSHKFV